MAVRKNIGDFYKLAVHYIMMGNNLENHKAYMHVLVIQWIVRSGQDMYCQIETNIRITNIKITNIRITNIFPYCPLIHYSQKRWHGII